MQFHYTKANISIATATRRKSLTCDQGRCWRPPLTFKYWYNISGELLSCLKSDSSWKELAGTGGRTAVANWSGVCSAFTEVFSLKDWPRSRFKSACGLEYYRALGNQLKKQQPKFKKGKSNRKLLTSDFAKYCVSYLHSDNVQFFQLVCVHTTCIFTMCVCPSLQIFTFWLYNGCNQLLGDKLGHSLRISFLSSTTQPFRNLNFGFKIFEEEILHFKAT